MGRKHHHQVSQGYQRLFAVDERVLLLDKSTKTAHSAGIHDTFARKHFCSELGPDGRWSDELEDKWQALENDALPHLRRLAAGARDGTAREAVKVVSAIHYVRTEAFLKMHERILDQVVGIKRRKIANDGRAVAALTLDLGRPPLPGELEENFDRVADVFAEGRRVFVRSMEETYHKTLGILTKLRVQLVWPRPGLPDFVFGDQALVHYDRSGRVSMLAGLALGDAHRAFLPLSQRLLALFSAEPCPDTDIPLNTVIELNSKTWEAAVRFIGSSPQTNLCRALGRWDIKVEPGSPEIASLPDEGMDARHNKGRSELLS
jgi:hypothetical protein